MAPWGFDDSWARYPLTPALKAVKGALEAGLVGADAIAYLVAHGISAAVVDAGNPWPGAPDYALVMWYRKSAGANGNFQWVDKTPDGPYLHGWDVRWNPNTWQSGPAPAGFPIGADGKHPTEWQLSPVSDPVSVPAPAPTPSPFPLPDDGAPDWFLSFMVDVHKLVDAIDELNSDVVALGTKLDALRTSGVKVHF